MPDERALVQRIFAQGPAALVEAGYDGDRATIFLSRDDVAREWSVLTREFDNQEIVWGHSKFIAKRQLTRLMPGATAILAQALAGPEYLRNDDGNIIVDVTGRPILVNAEVTGIQLGAAKDVLERMEVSGRVREDVMGKLNIKVLFEKDRSDEAKIEINPNLKTEEQRALSRERIRNVVEVLRAALPALQEKAQQMIEADARPPSRRPKKARATKKATAKKKPKRLTKKRKAKASAK